MSASSDARADRVTDAHRALAELEQRAAALSTNFRESYAPDPNAADRRVVEAQKLFALKNYSAAATLCLDVIEKYPQSRAFDDALVLLGESLFKDGDMLSARRYLEQAVAKNTGSRNEQVALQRLIELALRTGDYTNVEDHLARLSRIPPAQLEPSVPYVRGKYLFFRDRLDDALVSFQSIPLGQPYHLQSRYFIATIQVKKGDYATAARGFDEVLKLQPQDDNEKEIQDLARLAIGRLLYDRGQFERAKEWYASVPRQSKQFGEAMYESAWNSIKGGDFKSASRALDLMLLQNPSSAQAPELRLLVGNLHLRMSNFYLASNQFSQTLDEYEPIYRDLYTRLDQAKSDPKYFDGLLAKGLEKFEMTSIMPAGAARLITNEPDVAKLLSLAEELGALQKGLKESEALVDRLDRTVQSGGRLGIFRDVALAHQQSTTMLNQSIDMRRRFQSDARNIAANYLSPEDRITLAQISGERGLLDQEMKTLPVTQEAMRSRSDAVRGEFTALDARASEINVIIQSLQAELVAIEQYFVASKGDQRIKPEDLAKPVADLKAEIDVSQEMLEDVRRQIVETGQEASMAGQAGVTEHAAANRLAALLKREQEVLMRARSAMSPETGLQFDAYLSILQRADGIQSRLLQFENRLAGIADTRLAKVREQIQAERGNLAQANAKFGSVTSEGKDVGGSLAEVMMTKATERFYDLTVQSDVGLIDVSWGIKDSKTQAASKLINQQKTELQATEDDFGPLLKEDDK
ncbi:MAG TPA: tetratricopeptide repeat protein [Polyangia bacterium]